MDDDKENIAPSPTAARTRVPTHALDGTQLPGSVRRYNAGRLPTPIDDASEPVTPQDESNALGTLETPPDSGHRQAAEVARQERVERQSFTIFEDAPSPTALAHDRNATTPISAPIPARFLQELARRPLDGELAGVDGTTQGSGVHPNEASSAYRVDDEALAEWNRLIGRSRQTGSTTIDAASTSSSVGVQTPFQSAVANESSRSRKRSADGLDNQMPAKRARSWHDDVDFAAYGPDGSPVRVAAERIVARARNRVAVEKLASVFDHREAAPPAEQFDDVRRSFGHGPPTLAVDQQSGRAYINIPIPYHVTPPPQRHDTGLKVDAPLPAYENSASPRLVRVSVRGGWSPNRATALDNIEPSGFAQGRESPDWLSESIKADRGAEQPSRSGTPDATKGCDRSPARNRSRSR